MGHILTEHSNRIGTLTLNHHERRNALSAALVGDLLDGLDVMEQAKTRVVILRAAPGAKVWSTTFTSCPKAEEIHSGSPTRCAPSFAASKTSPRPSSRWSRAPCGAARASSP